jgi:hypothetical protein
LNSSPATESGAGEATNHMIPAASARSARMLGSPTEIDDE